MNKTLLSTVISLFLLFQVCGQETDISSLKYGELDSLMGAWIFGDSINPSEQYNAVDYSWGPGLCLPNGTITIDELYSKPKTICIENVGGGYFIIKKIKRSTETDFILIVRNDAQYPIYGLPDEGVISIKKIGDNKVEISDSEFPILGLANGRQSFIKLAGPDTPVSL